MNFEAAEIENPLSPQGKNKILGVIVLRDNRINPPFNKHISSDYRCSAFKQTQVDPLQFPQNPDNFIHDECSISKLTQRVIDLQERLKVLSNLDGFNNSSNRYDGKSLKKKNRRKFKELIRDQKCSICQKNYGSETALKYHLKLKHAQNNENHSQSN